MKAFIDILKEKVVIFDGAMGTSIQEMQRCSVFGDGHSDDFSRSPNTENRKPCQDVCNEYLNILRPDIISQIHSDFLSAGADVVETNTFGALPYLLKEYGLADKATEINRAGVKLALEVANAFSTDASPRFVSGSMGPGTKLPSLGQIGFDELYADYLLQAECLVSECVHLIQIETGQDPLQMKIALKAVLDSFKRLKREVPIFLQATLQDNGQMLVGTDLLTFIHTFRDMPITALGINCGTGPQHIENYLRILTEHCPKYISILPNAGMPVLKDGVLTYDLSPTQFGSTCADLVKKYRINAIGGCCGTTAEFIKELSVQCPVSSDQKRTELERLDSLDTTTLTTSGHWTLDTGHSPYLTSLFSSQEIKTSPPPLLVGERANVNGSKKFRALLAENKWDEMVELCLTQQEEGAHLVDINLATIGRDEAKDYATFIPLLNKALSIPIMIDSTSYQAIETALKYTAGKAIVNSTNFENGEELVIKYIELCRDMNAALICLTIDEQGMAKTFEHKLSIINRFLALCDKYSFPRGLIFIDCLTFALSTGEDTYRGAASESIKTIKYISENYPEVNTIMGVSNVSFGLKPSTRKILNSVFLHQCVKNGLTSAIVDSSKILPVNDISDTDLKLCLNLIYNDTADGDPLEQLMHNAQCTIHNEEGRMHNEELSTKYLPTLREAVIKGRSADLPEIIEALVVGTPNTENQTPNTENPLDIINTILIPAMQEVGALFEQGKIALPFVLKSAEVMKKSVDLLKPHIDNDCNNAPIAKPNNYELSTMNYELKPSLLLATVQGDVHDIGKNLVQIIIENNGYTVYDIGVKQTPHDIYTAICTHNPTALGMSALLIKSTGYMKETLAFLKEKGINIPIICGGAALNEDFVKKELQAVYDGTVAFGKDAFAGLKFMQNIGVTGNG